MSSAAAKLTDISPEPSLSMADLDEISGVHVLPLLTRLSSVRLVQNFTLGCSTHAQSGPPGP